MIGWHHPVEGSHVVEDVLSILFVRRKWIGSAFAQQCLFVMLFLFIYSPPRFPLGSYLQNVCITAATGDMQGCLSISPIARINIQFPCLLHLKQRMIQCTCARIVFAMATVVPKRTPPQRFPEIIFEYRFQARGIRRVRHLQEILLLRNQEISLVDPQLHLKGSNR